MKKILNYAAAVLLLSSAAAFAAVPGYINFQGRLLNLNKLPQTGSYSMTFKVCDSLAGSCTGTCATGNACLWTETQPTVVVTNGVFAVQLGSYTALTSDAFLAATRYLEITVGLETLSPREELAAGAYSFRASVADSLAVNSSSITLTGPITASSATFTSPLGVWSAGINMAANVFISSTASAAQGGGVYVSSNAYIVGFSSAAKYYGDGSNLTGLPDSTSNESIGGVKTFTSSLTVTNALGIWSAGVGMAANVYISSETTSALGAGVRISTNAYLVGFSSAAKYYGDGSPLTGVVDLTSSENIGGAKTFTSSLTVTNSAGLWSPSMALASNVAVSSETTPALGAGVRISTNAYIVGFSSASAYYGSGAGLTDLRPWVAVSTSGIPTTLTANTEKLVVFSTITLAAANSQVFVMGNVYLYTVNTAATAQARLRRSAAGASCLTSSTLVYQYSGQHTNTTGLPLALGVLALDAPGAGGTYVYCIGVNSGAADTVQSRNLAIIEAAPDSVSSKL